MYFPPTAPSPTPNAHNANNHNSNTDNSNADNASNSAAINRDRNMRPRRSLDSLFVDGSARPEDRALKRRYPFAAIEEAVEEACDEVFKKIKEGKLDHVARINAFYGRPKKTAPESPAVHPAGPSSELQIITKEEYLRSVPLSRTSSSAPRVASADRTLPDTRLRPTTSASTLPIVAAPPSGSKVTPPGSESSSQAVVKVENLDAVPSIAASSSLPQMEKAVRVRTAPPHRPASDPHPALPIPPIASASASTAMAAPVAVRRDAGPQNGAASQGVVKEEHLVAVPPVTPPSASSSITTPPRPGRAPRLVGFGSHALPTRTRMGVRSRPEWGSQSVIRRRTANFHHQICASCPKRGVIDHTAHPEIIDMILKNVPSFSTLLKFRATSQSFWEKNDKGLRHLVIFERPGRTPYRDPTIHVQMASGWPIVQGSSSQCANEDCYRAATSANPEACRVVKYLNTKISADMDTDEADPMGVVDLMGEIQPNFKNQPHFVHDFLDRVFFFEQVRHMPDTTGGVVSHPSVVFAPADDKLVILNDWLAPRRNVDLVSLDRTVPRIIYHFTPAVASVSRAQPQAPFINPFINTYIKGAKEIVYDFTPHRTQKPNPRAPKRVSDTLEPVHHLVRHTVRYLADGASIIFVGRPDLAWFDPWYYDSCGDDGSQHLPAGWYRWFAKLVSRECARNGIDDPADNVIRFISRESSEADEFAPDTRGAGLEQWREPMIVSGGF